MTALKAAQVDAFVAKPNPAQPVVLVYGADAGLVRERAEALVRASVDDLNDPFSLVRLEGDLVAGERRALFHCASGNRVGGTMIPYLMLDRGMSEDDAVTEAMKMGTRSAELIESALAFVQARQKP